MKITLITNLNNGSENQRLLDEAVKLGHHLTIIRPEDITISIKNGELHYPEVCDTLPDVVILRGILMSIKKTIALIEHMRKDNIKVFDNNLGEMQYSIDKVSDLAKLALAKMPLPDTEYANSYEKFVQMAKVIGYPVIVKPINTGKGIGVTKIESQKQLEQYVRTRQKGDLKAKQLIIQQYIPYEYDLRILVIGENTFTMRRIPGEGEFRANYSLGGRVELYSPSKETETLAIQALNSINMSVGGVDVLITKDNKQYILEVNHSPGFEGMEKATGQNIAQIFLTHAITHATQLQLDTPGVD